VEVSRFKYLESVKAELNAGRRVIDLKNLEEIKIEDLFERL